MTPCQAQVWVLWVPCNEEKTDLSYFDNSVRVAADQQQKAPTERQLQQMMEGVQTTWQNEDSLLFTKAVSAPSDLPGAGSGGQQSSSGNLLSGSSAPNRKGRKGSGSSGATFPGAPCSSFQPSQPNLTVQCVKHKKSTVKDNGQTTSEI